MNKHRHLKMVEAKWNFMHKQVDEFALFFNPLVKRGLSFFWEEKGLMLSQKEYRDRLIECRQDHRQFEYMSQQSLLVKVVVKKLSSEFELIFDFRVLCTKFPAPSYLENIELIVLAEEMIKLEMPSANQWKVIENYVKAKYKLHQ